MMLALLTSELRIQYRFLALFLLFLSQIVLLQLCSTQLVWAENTQIKPQNISAVLTQIKPLSRSEKSGKNTVSTTEHERKTLEHVNRKTGYQLNFNGIVPEPIIFKTQQPYHLVLDFPRVGNKISNQMPELIPPIFGIQTAHDHAKTRVIFSLNIPFDYHLKREKNQIQVIFSPSNTESNLPSTFSGTVTLDVQNLPLHEVLATISAQAGQNVLITNSIPQENISLRLFQTPWHDALDILADAYQLTLEETLGTLVISGNPETEEPANHSLNSNELKTNTTQNTVSIKPNMATEIFPLHYADAEDLLKKLPPYKLQKDSAPPSQRFRSPDQRTNSLIVHDVKTNMEQINNVIKELDTPVKQVSISSKIVIATHGFSNELGARIGLFGTGKLFPSWQFSLAGNAVGSNNVITGEKISFGDRLLINVPAANPMGSIGISLAKISSNIALDLELAAAQLEGKTRTITKPTVIVMDGYEAVIRQGVQIPYHTTSENEGMRTSFKDAVMELRVTPKITPDNQVILQAHIKKDAVGATLCDSCEPSIETREIKTHFMINNGETLVIGGIYETSHSEVENRVPGLSNIPVAGQLFRHTSREDNQRELLVFITPFVEP